MQNFGYNPFLAVQHRDIIDIIVLLQFNSFGADSHEKDQIKKFMIQKVQIPIALQKQYLA